jgi:hypothetical protein
MQQAAPRIASVFAAQQRWLMAHAALAQYFRSVASDGGMAFLKQMLYDDVVRLVVDDGGRRYRPLEPAPAVLTSLFSWHALHLATLDRLDAGNRVACFNRNPALLRAIHPLIADALIRSNEVRAPEGTFSLFTWVNEGGIVMDRLMVGCEPASSDGLARVPTDVTSISGLARHLKLSRAGSAANSPRPRRREAWVGLPRGANRRCGSRRSFGVNISPLKPSSLRSSTRRSMPCAARGQHVAGDSVAA